MIGNGLKKYKKKAIVSGGIIELYEYKESQYLGFDKSGGTSGRTKGSKSVNYGENREKTMNKARVMVKRLVSANLRKNSKFVTLTFKENIVNLKEANYEFKKFRQRLIYHLKRDIKYLCVPEFTRIGRVHYHVVFFNLPYMENNDLRSIWDNGFIKINKIDFSTNVGSYVSKYLSKDSDKLEGEKSYFCSRNLVQPKKIYDEKKIQELVDIFGYCLKYENNYSNNYVDLNYKQFNTNV